MKTNDYNGSGFWAVDSVINRYESYVRRFNVASPSDIQPRIHTNETMRWIYPIMDEIIECIERKDLACAEIGIEFIEESDSFPFGKILKYNTARALRRISDSLTSDQKERIRKRVAEMLRTGYLPREFRQYAKLARKIGMKTWMKKIESDADLDNRWVKHYCEILRNNHTE